jgi:hypothetical protein
MLYRVRSFLFLPPCRDRETTISHNAGRFPMRKNRYNSVGQWSALCSTAGHNPWEGTR